MITAQKRQYNKNYWQKNRIRLIRRHKEWEAENQERLKEYRRSKRGLYYSWQGMRARCNNPNNKQFKDYGGRGITYDPKWETFVGFKQDMQPIYKKGLTLERIDNNGNYIKSNCQWATRQEQNWNKRCNISITYRGKTMILPEWAKFLEIDFGTLRSRYYRKMSTPEILKAGLYRPQKKICV